MCISIKLNFTKYVYNLNKILLNKYTNICISIKLSSTNMYINSKNFTLFYKLLKTASKFVKLWNQFLKTPTNPRYVFINFSK